LLSNSREDLTLAFVSIIFTLKNTYISIDMNKIKFYFLGITILLLAGCSRMFNVNFQKFDDEFKNSRKIIARIDLGPEERRTEINWAHVIFEREISDKQDNVKAYFVISRSSNSFKIENSGYLKAGGQSFEINITNALTEYKSKNETSVETYTKTDSTGVKTGQKTEIDENIWIDDKFIFSLTPEMISKIKNSDEFIVRFYFGPIPATYRFKGSKLKPVQRMLNE
jgi:hypothetical protein